MKKRILGILILAMIVLDPISYSYAYLNGGTNTNCYCPTCGIAFATVTTSDNEIEKDVANTYA